MPCSQCHSQHICHMHHSACHAYSCHKLSQWGVLSAARFRLQLPGPPGLIIFSCGTLIGTVVLCLQVTPYRKMQVQHIHAQCTNALSHYHVQLSTQNWIIGLHERLCILPALLRINECSVTLAWMCSWRMLERVTVGAGTSLCGQRCRSERVNQEACKKTFWGQTEVVREGQQIQQSSTFFNFDIRPSSTADFQCCIVLRDGCTIWQHPSPSSSNYF